MRLGSRCSRMLLSVMLLLAPTQLRAEPPNQAKPAKPLKLMESPRGFLEAANFGDCLLYTSPSPRDATLSRMPSSA